MITLIEAKNLVLKRFTDLAEYLSETDDEIAFFDDLMEEKLYGWVLFFNSKKYKETGDLFQRIQGVGGVIVNKFTGEVHEFFSHRRIDEQIAEYEKRLLEK